MSPRQRNWNICKNQQYFQELGIALAASTSQKLPKDWKKKLDGKNVPAIRSSLLVQKTYDDVYATCEILNSLDNLIKFLNEAKAALHCSIQMLHIMG